MPKDYPLFIIDRNRRSRDANHQFDYLVCLNKEIGFVSKVILFKKEAFATYIEDANDVDHSDIGQYNMWLKDGNAGVAIIIVDYIHDFERTPDTQERIKSLLKKALKKYLYDKHQMVELLMEPKNNIELIYNVEE